MSLNGELDVHYSTQSNTISTENCTPMQKTANQCRKLQTNAEGCMQLQFTTGSVNHPSKNIHCVSINLYCIQANYKWVSIEDKLELSNQLNIIQLNLLQRFFLNPNLLPLKNREDVIIRVLAMSFFTILAQGIWHLDLDSNKLRKECWGNCQGHLSYFCCTD